MKKSALLVGLLAALLILPACSKKQEQSKESTAAPQQQQATQGAATTTAQGDMAQGQKVYEANCKACHGAGIAGAPKLGDKAAWADRIAQGMDTLDKNAINGFTGKTGTMPAKGGNASLSDAEVKAAVQYMVDQSK